MDLKVLHEIAHDLLRDSAENRIQAEISLRPELSGMKIFKDCLLACADAADPIFAELKV